VVLKVGSDTKSKGQVGYMGGKEEWGKMMRRVVNIVST
jgi:hypothetical protein